VTIFWLKIIHIAAVSLWMAGLACLPGLFVQRTHLGKGETLFRLQRLVRFAYIALMSPAAFVAVGSGTALIFAREIWTPWLSAKLALVAGLVLVHTLAGLVAIRLFDEGEAYPVWRFICATSITVLLILGVLLLVLAKPDFEFSELLPDVFSEPGALKRLADALNPWPRP
jgi:putative membrane protein